DRSPGGGAAAEAGIKRFQGRNGDDAARTPFETQYFGRTPEAVQSARAQVVTTGLRELTMKMGDLKPARGALILISEGFVKGPGATRAVLRERRRRPRGGSHSTLPIYTLDPGDPAPVADGASSPPPPDRSLDTLQSLATQTGGEAVSDAREPVPAPAR